MSNWKLQYALVGFVVGCACAVPGCKQGEVVYPTDKDLGSNDQHQQPLMPGGVTLNGDEDKDLLAQVSKPDLSHLQPVADPAAEEEVDEEADPAADEDEAAEDAEPDDAEDEGAGEADAEEDVEEEAEEDEEVDSGDSAAGAPAAADSAVASGGTGASTQADDMLAIRTVLPKMMGALNNDNWEELPTFFVPDQAQQLSKFVPTVTPLISKFETLNQTLLEAGGEEFKQQLGPQAALDPKKIAALLQPILAFAPVRLVDADHATVQVKMPFGGGDDASMDVPFTKVGDAWKIEIPNFPSPEMLDKLLSALQQSTPELVQRIDDFTGRLQTGMLSAQNALGELPQVLQPLNEAIAPIIMEYAAGQEAEDPGVLGEIPQIGELVGKRNSLLQAGEFRQAVELYAPEFRDAANQEMRVLELAGKIAGQLKGATSEARAKQLYDGFLNLKALSGQRQDDGTLVVKLKLGAASLPFKEVVFREEAGQWYIVAEPFAVEAGARVIAINNKTLGNSLLGILNSLEGGKLTPDGAADQLIPALQMFGVGMKPGQVFMQRP